MSDVEDITAKMLGFDSLGLQRLRQVAFFEKKTQVAWLKTLN
jgi:hypothetical protein